MTEPDGKTMIRLEHLTKVYPGSTQPAVDDVTMDIPQGEIVIFVGPSGCGKTTTMRMINRLIEPSSGRIILDGEDVTRVSPDALRRRMGYVIQQIGLFPHWRIEDNIALVPKMLGWDAKRVSDRVDELLTLIGLDPATFRKRYPKQLSGGQRQRVGVARALAADPPVMLMDEPFGAVDPINRDRLQNEFLRLQRDIRKTIVFVTHDIDEAIKMGDRICILREGSQIAQYDTPENILAAPADAFVADFLGAGASLKGLNLMHVYDVSLSQDWATAPHTASRDELIAAIDRSSAPYVLLLDENRRPVRWLSRRDLQMPERSAGEASASTATVGLADSLHSALNTMLTNQVAAAPVTDAAGAYQGVVDIEAIKDVVDAVRQRARLRSAGGDERSEALAR